jgi:hypothetical protein
MTPRMKSRMTSARDIFFGIIVRAAAKQIKDGQVRGKLPPAVAIDILKSGVTEQAPTPRKNAARKIARKNLAGRSVPGAAPSRARCDRFTGKV